MPTDNNTFVSIETSAYLKIFEDRVAGKAIIFYCFPDVYGSPQSGRKYIEIHLDVPGGWEIGERPFYAKLINNVFVNNISRTRNIVTIEDILSSYVIAQRNHIKDVLILYVYRDVTVTQISTTEGNIIYESNYIMFDVNEVNGSVRAGGRRNRIKVALLYRRMQYKKQLPESVENGYSNILDGGFKKIFLASNIEMAKVMPVAPEFYRAINGIDHVHGDVFILFVESRRNDGGIDIDVYKSWVPYRTRSQRGNDYSVYQEHKYNKLIAKITLKVRNRKRPAAWKYTVDIMRCRTDNNGVSHKAKLVIAIDKDNILIIVKKNNRLSDSSTPTTDIEHLQLIIKAFDIDRVPTEDSVINIERLRGNSINYRFRNLNDYSELQETAVKITIELGFSLAFPFYSDIVDIGEFVWALLNRTDRWGDSVTTTDLVIMGIAALPIIPGAITRLRSISDGRGVISRIQHRINELPPSVKESLERLLRNILENKNLSNNSVVDIVTDNITTMTGPRDPELVRLLDL